MARGPYPAILRIARATEKFFGVPVNGEHVIYPAIIRIAQALEASKIEDIDDVIEELEKNANKPYTSLNRLGAYLYETTFGTIPDLISVSNLYTGGCSAFVRDGKLYRNLDWKYSETAEFKVITKDFRGMSFISGLNDNAELDSKLVGQLPYYINDGVNNDGIMVATLILYNDWSYTGSGNKDKGLKQIPYYILSNLHSMDDINTVLSDYLANIKVEDDLVSADYLLQFIVSDGTTTYGIIPPETDGSSYVLQNITSIPKMTNFRWLNKATLERNDSDLQTRPNGVERWNAIETQGVSLSDLRYTKCYESTDRLSEFIGINETTKDSTDEELEAIYTLAREAYLSRTRDGETLQTCHSVVYGNKDFENLFVQEDYIRDYGKRDIDEEVAKVKPYVVIAEDNTLVDGESVPELTAQQCIDIYNAHIAGKQVILKDAGAKYYHLGTVAMETESGETSVILNFIYEDKMILTYTANNTVVITYKEFDATEPVIIQVATHQDFDGYFIPSLSVEQVQSAFDNFSAGKPVLINDSLDFTKTSILEVSTIAGTAIRILFGGVLLLTYTISTETEPSSVVVTGGKLAFQE